MAEKKMSEMISESDEYVIPVSWNVYSTITVEASNLEEAVKKARELIDEIPLGDSEYVDGSYAIGTNEECVQAFENGYVEMSTVSIDKTGAIRS